MSAPAATMGCDTLNASSACVLDDDVHIGRLVCQLLVANGFTPRQFADPVTFLTEVKASSPKLIVLDLALGQTDAIEIIRKLEVIKYEGKLLLMSGHDETVLDKIKQIGASRGLAMVPPLRKPFRANDLKRSLEAPVEISCAPVKAQNSPVKPVVVDLAEALANRWLELWYQPKIDLNSMKICSAEALARVRHPKHGIVLPASFLPAANDPVYLPLTKFVIQQALEDWSYFNERQVLLKLAVNIPLSTLRTSEFVTYVREALPKDPQFPGFLFEITEDEVTGDVTQIDEIAAQLGLCNIGLSIDDFGAGYSSLSRLRDLPCAEVKIDRSFVSNCSLDGAKQSLCNAAIELAHKFGASVCAEGVENPNDLQKLIEMRCDTAQGSLFARPMSREAIVQMLSDPAEPSSHEFLLSGALEPEKRDYRGQRSRAARQFAL